MDEWKSPDAEDIDDIQQRRCYIKDRQRIGAVLHLIEIGSKK